MCEFLKADVITLANAILEGPIEYSDGDYDDYYWCTYCGNRSEDGFTMDVTHKLNCPVLIAQDILTRQKK